MLASFFRQLPEQPVVSDATTVDRTFRAWRMRILVTLTVVYGFFYTCRIGLSVVKKPLIDGGVYTATELGQIGACMLWGYALGKLVNGVFADRVNVARFIPAGLLVSALANLAMGSTTWFALACVLWVANGLAQGVGATASVVSLTHWFKHHERGRSYGVWSAAHSLGEGMMFFGTSALVVAYGWRAGFLAPGIACVGVAFVAALLLSDRPRSRGLPHVDSWNADAGDAPPIEDEDISTGQAQLQVLRNPSIWICAIASGLMYVSRYAVTSWGVLYLQEARGFSLAEAAQIVGVHTIAGFFGSAAYGFVSDLVFGGRRPPVTLLFGAVEVGALVLIFYGPASSAVLIVAFVLFGFTLSGLQAVLGGLFAVDMSSRRATGMAMGFVGFVSYFGATVQDLMSGRLIDAGTQIVDGKKSIDFSVATAMWVGASVLSLLLALTLWNKGAKTAVTPRAVPHRGA